MAKTVVKACVLALAGILGVTYVGASVATQSWNPAEWVKPGTEIVRPAPDLTDNADKGGVVVSNGKSYGISLMSARIAPEAYEDYGISTQAENATLLTATFTPAATTNKAVIWTVSGGNGKVTVTPVSGNSLQATVTVTGSFSTQAVVTCTSSANSSVKATATVNYVKTLNDGQAWLNFDSIKDENDINELLTFKEGTVMPTEFKGDVYLNMDNDLYNHLSPKWSNYLNRTVHFTDRDEYFDSQCYGFENFFKNTSSLNKEALYEDIAIYFYGQTNVEIAYLSYEDVYTYYNSKEVDFYEDQLLEIPCVIKSFSDITVNPQSLTLNNTSLIFGPNGLVN